MGTLLRVHPIVPWTIFRLFFLDGSRSIRPFLDSGISCLGAKRLEDLGKVPKGANCWNQFLYWENIYIYLFIWNKTIHMYIV